MSDRGLLLNPIKCPAESQKCLAELKKVVRNHCIWCNNIRFSAGPAVFSNSVISKIQDVSRRSRDLHRILLAVTEYCEQDSQARPLYKIRVTRIWKPNGVTQRSAPVRSPNLAVCFSHLLCIWRHASMTPLTVINTSWGLLNASPIASDWIFLYNVHENTHFCRLGAHDRVFVYT